MKCTLCSTAYRSTGFVIALLLMFALPQRSWGQAISPSTTTTLTSTATNVLESLTGWVGTATTTGVTSWQLAGAGTTGNTLAGSNQSGGASGGWYGNGNISFLGSANATNGCATLRLINGTGTTLTSFRVVYQAMMWKSGTASPSVTYSWSTAAASTMPTTGTNLTNTVSALGFSDAVTTTTVTPVTMAATITGASIPNNNYLFMRWLHSGNSNADNLGWDEIYVVPTPTTQASSINFTTVSYNQMTVNWTNGNGRRRAVFMKLGAGAITNPTDGTLYTANTVLGSGTQLGSSGYYCVYDGTGSSVTVTGLTPTTTYFVQVFDYNSDATPTAATITYNTSAVSASQTTSALTHYYSLSSGFIDDVNTWGINTDGTGSHPSNFTTATQLFHLANNNPGTITGSSWTVSGGGSKIYLDGTDITVTSSKPIVGTMQIASGRTITLQNTTIPTLDTISNSSTVIYANGTANTLNYTSTYGNLVFDGSNTSVTNPGSKSRLKFAGNLTVRNSASFSGNNITFVPTSTAAQTITGNSLTLAVDSIVSIAANKTGTLTLASGTPMTISGSIVMDNSNAGNAFSDGGNTLNVVGSVSMTGNAAGYVLTGTINAAPTSATNFFGATTASPVVAALNNVTVSTTSPVTFNPTAVSAATTTLSGNLTVSAASTVTLGANTIALGGNYTWVPSSGSLVSSNTSIIFNGGTAQTYSTGLAAGHTFSITTLNNSAGLTLSAGNITTPTFNWTSGNLSTNSGTSTTVGPVFTTSVVAGSGAKTFLGGGTWDGSSGANGGVLKLNGTSSASGGITVGSPTSTFNSGILDLGTANAWTSSNGTITINPSSQLYLSAAAPLTGCTITLNGNGNNVTTTYGIGALKTGATVSLTSNATVNIASGTTISLGNALTLSGVVNFNGELTKRGTGTLNIFGTSNTGTGGIRISEGSVNVNSAATNGISSSAYPITFNPAVTGSYSLTLGVSQTISNLSTVWPSAAVTGTQTLTLASGTTLTINQASDSTFGVNPGATGTGLAAITATGANIIKTGAGVLRLTGTQVNHTGSLTVNNGGLVLSPSTTVTLGTAGATISGGTLTLSPSGTLTLSSTGGVNINGGGLVVSNTAGSTATGAITLSSGTLSASNASTLTMAGITQSGGAITMSGSASVGTGALTLSGGTARIAQTAGTTTVGAMNVSGSAAVSLANTSTLTASGITQSGGSLTLSSSALTSTGAITLSGGTTSMAPTAGTTTMGNLNVSGTAALTAANSTTLNGGTITQTGGAISLTGSASMSLSTSNISGGNLSVINSGGTTTLGNTTISGTAAVSLSNGSTLTMGTITQSGGSVTISNTAVLSAGATSLTGGTMVNNGSANVTTTGAVVINGGALTISNTAGLVSYSGTTTLTSGSLTIAPAGSGLNVSTSALLLNGGAFKLIPSSGTTLTVGAVRLGGSSFSTVGLTASNIIVNGGVVTLATSSTITLDPTTPHSLKFAATTAAWAGSSLVIYGWNGNFDGTAGTTGRIYFGSDTAGLLVANKNKITFYNAAGNNFVPATILSTGEVVPKATITTGTVTTTPPMYNDVTNPITVAYTYTGPVPTSVNVELSDNTGSFTGSVTVIGTGTASPVAATIPSAIAVGSYKVRVVETSPITISGSASASFNILGHPPVLTSVSTYSAAPGATITLTGTNFNAVAAKQKVFFGATWAVPVSGSTTSLSVVVPLGASADFISLFDTTTHLEASSTIKFYPDYVNDYFTTTLTMQDAIGISVARATNQHNPWNTAVGDLDGDGRPDMVVATASISSPNATHFSYFRNVTTGNGANDMATASFQYVNTQLLQGFVANIKIADLDGDGKPDIIAPGGSGSVQVNILHNNTSGYGTAGVGSITFQGSPANIPTGGVYSPRVATIADFDKDGKLDIAVACNGTYLIPSTMYDTLVILSNATSSGVDFTAGSFTYSKYGASYNQSSSTNGGTSLCAADFDADGDVDIAMVEQRFPGNISKIALFSNNSSIGSVSFVLADTIVAGNYTTDITAGDFNNDNLPDIAVANQYGSEVKILQNGGAFTFNTTTTVPGTTGWAPASLNNADMNGDGKTDLVVVNSNSVASRSDTVAVFTNISSGSSITFSSPTILRNAAGKASAGVTIADVDLDKYPDIIVANLLSDTVTIIRNKPTLNVGSIGGVSTVCHNSSITLSYVASATPSPSGVTPAYSTSPLPSDLGYGWYTTDTNAAKIDSTTGVLTAVGHGPVNAQYVIFVNGTNITDTLSSAVSITYVYATYGGDPTICLGDTVGVITYADTVGSPITYSLLYDATGHAQGLTDAIDSTLTGGSIAVIIPAGVVNSSYPITLTISDGTCVSDPLAIPANVIVADTPVVLLTSSADSLCKNRDAIITFTGAPGNSFNYSVDGGASTPATLDIIFGTYEIAIPHLDASHSYVLTSATNGSCSSIFADTVTIRAIDQAWTGALSTRWDTAANWTCALVPTDSDVVTIPVTTNQPDLSASLTATSLDLTIASGATITLNTSSILNVKGDLTNNGHVYGAGKMSLSGTSAQQISGIGIVNNIELNNSAGATINTGSRLVVGSTLSITSGTLTTNDSLELSSDINGTARVAAIPASGAAISGKVKVDQYIQANYRRFRFWAHPFDSAISLGQLQPYMDITGSGGSANGFTTTTTNNPSAFKLVVAYSNPGASYDPGWVPITKIDGAENDTNMLHRHQGLRLFMRGAKGEGLGGFAYVPSANIVSMKGTLNQGDQLINLEKGSAIQDFNFIGNPYASPVDIGEAMREASDSGFLVGTAFYVWNAGLGATGGGQYQALDFVVGGVTQHYSLPAYASFQLRTVSNGNHLRITENMKTASATSYLFKPGNTPYVSLHVYDESYHPWDMLNIRFDDNASDSEDIRLDAVKPAGGDLSFYSLSADGRKMVIDARPFDAGKIIPLGVRSSYKQNYIIRAEHLLAPDNGAVVLHDKLLNKYVTLSEGTEYKFTIDNDKATQGENRFELALKPGQSVANRFSVVMTPNPATDDVKISFTTADANKVVIRVTDIKGVCVYTTELAASTAGQVTIPVGRLASGAYMVEVVSGEQKSVQKLIKE